MVIQVKLYALLRLRHKHYDSNNGISITIKESLCIMDLLTTIGINSQDVSVVFVNDKAIKRLHYFLNDGDIVKIFPYLPAGG